MNAPTKSMRHLQGSDVTQSFNFSVDSALLGELGEKLVSTVHVALAELVKNAYDADATEVHVKIAPQENGAPRITISDNGSGMTVEDIERYWMKIGTSNKQEHPLSTRFGRPRTGSKGVGRFACRRLGLNLRLITCARVKPKSGPVEYHQTTVEFPWLAFQAGIDVEAIPCTGKTIIRRTGTTGTALEIWGGHNDEWATRGFNYLQRQLAALSGNRGVKRDGYEPDPGFNSFLDAPQLTDTPIDIRESIIEASWGTVSASVDKKGCAVCQINGRGLGGTKQYKSQPLFPRIGGASIRFGLLPTKKEDARKPALLAGYVLNDLVDQWGGLQLRLNGFRVYPYGDPGDDWLMIDADRGRRLGKPSDELFDFASSLNSENANRSLLNMLGMRNYLGQVELSSSISGLTPRIDRQGFIENPTFDEVRRFARFVVDWANIYRDHYVQLKAQEETEKAREAIRPILNLDGPKEQIVPKATKYLRKEIKQLVTRLPTSQQKGAEQTLLASLKAIESANSEGYRQLQHLRLVASASTLTLLFAHEVRTVIGGLGAAAKRLSQLEKKVPAHSGELGALSLQLVQTKERFDNLVKMTGIVGSFRSSETAHQIHLRGALDRAIQCFNLIISNYKIEVRTKIPNNVSVGPMIEGELYTVLLNVLSNSIKSVIASGKKERLIEFEAFRVGNSTTLAIRDNGLGLDSSFFSDVFTPFISDPSGELYDRLEARANPEDASIFGTGSGLGLSIARDVARARNGDIHFVPPTKPWAACVEIQLP